MEPIVWEAEPPKLRSPVLVCAFRGWNDAAGAATTALSAIAESLDAKSALLSSLAAHVNDDTIVASTTSSLSVDALAVLMGATQRVASAMVDGLGAQGSFVAVNNTVSQSVPHLHVHVVPRTKGDGLRGFFWPRTRYAAGEAATFAARLREAIGPPP